MVIISPVPKPSRRAAQNVERNATDGHRRLVMIVDDDPDVLEALEDAIIARGFDVVTARNGREALDNMRSGEAPHLILLDMMMPEMNGWQFRIEQLRDPTIANIPVVAVTAGNTAPWDVDDVILKPISSEKLNRALKLASYELPDDALEGSE